MSLRPPILAGGRLFGGVAAGPGAWAIVWGLAGLAAAAPSSAAGS